MTTRVEDPEDGTVETPTTRLRVHYRAWGRAARGHDPVACCLLVHGLGSSCRIWDLVAPLLVDRGMVVVAMDQRGHGQTAKPEDGYDLATLAADALGLAQALALPRPLVVGHSWGASTALACAAYHPDAFSGAVLVDGGLADLPARPGASWERTQRDMAQADLGSVRMADLLEQVALGDLRDLDPAYREAFFHSMFDVRQDGTLRSHLSHHNHQLILRALWEQDHAGLQARVRAAGLPLLALISSQTTFGGQTVEFLAANRAGAAALPERVPGARVIWMEDTIHDIPLQRPAELAAAIADVAAGREA